MVEISRYVHRRNWSHAAGNARDDGPVPGIAGYRLDSVRRLREHVWRSSDSGQPRMVRRALEQPGVGYIDQDAIASAVTNSGIGQRVERHLFGLGRRTAINWSHPEDVDRRRDSGA